MRSDPTRTTGLQKQFLKAIRLRFKQLAAAIQQLVVEDDAFGLDEPRTSLRTLAKKEWAFATDAEKAKRFQAWLEDQVDTTVLGGATPERPWPATFIERAYERGATAAWVDARGPARARDKADFFAGAKQEQLRRLFSDRKVLEKVRTLATRTYEEVKGLSSKAKQDLGRILANGLLQQKSKKAIANEMVKRIDGLTKARALRIARTEIVAAHAEAQLDTFESLGVEEVVPYAEWRTAAGACPLCAPMEKVVLTIGEARGLIPRHPNCRCSWRVVKKAPKDRLRKARRALRRSVRAERYESTWPGPAALN